MIELELKGELFKSSYSLYIIEIKCENKSYFYIGQTGDNNHIMARAPIRRLMGHLIDVKSSTQNQLYRYIVEKILKVNFNDNYYKKKVETFLTESALTLYSFPLEEFIYYDNLGHNDKRNKVQEFEKQVIYLFANSKKTLMNKRVPKRCSLEIKYKKQFDEICKRFNVN